MNARLKYALYYATFRPLAQLPLSALYLLAGVLRFFFERVVHYRREIVRRNLRNSFPEKTAEELDAIIHDFYSQFADNIVEIIKLLHISDREVDRRIEVRGLDVVEQLADRGHSIIVYLGHYGNWEWVPASVRNLRNPAYRSQVYKPLRDKAFDRLMLKIRSRFSTVSIPQDAVFRTLVRRHLQGQLSLCGFIADQRSNNRQNHHAITFMGQSTHFNPGGEEIGSRINAAYVYLDVEKPRRGHYRFTFREILPDSSDVDYPYTRAYYRMLEQTIRRRPGMWLWSHRRWVWDNQNQNKTENKTVNR